MAQLNDLVTYQFQTDDALIYSEQTMSLYKIAAGQNDFLNSYLTDAGAIHANLLSQINSARTSSHTPNVRKWDDARTTEEGSLEQYLSSITQRHIKSEEIAQKVMNADRLLQVIGQKCPNFKSANDNQQTVHIDALKTELLKEEYKPLIENTGIGEMLQDLYTYNDNFKQASEQRKNEKEQETPQVRALRTKLMEKLSQFHSNLKQLIEKNPGTYNDIIQQINGSNAEIMTRIRARLTRELHSKGTTDAIVVEPTPAAAS